VGEVGEVGEVGGVSEVGEVGAIDGVSEVERPLPKEWLRHSAELTSKLSVRLF